MKPHTLPVRWTAPECLYVETARFSEATDVWAFGITVIEIFSDGQRPYLEIDSNSELIDRVKEGYRIRKPANCPDEVYAMVMECCSLNPKERPSFQDLAQRLQVDLKANYIYQSHNVPVSNTNLYVADGSPAGRQLPAIPGSQEKIAVSTPPEMIPALYELNKVIISLFL
jgi:serine/threonine protein kinase